MAGAQRYGYLFRHRVRAERALACAGHAETTKAKASAMRYDQMREHVQAHFRALLMRFQEDVSLRGPVGEGCASR